MAVSRRRPRLLCYRALGLGDLLTALPALRALRRGFPDHELVVATPPELHPLVTLAGCADALLPARGLAPPIWPGRPPDLAVNLHGSGPESHTLLRRLRPHRLVAFRCERAGWTEGPPWRRDEHEVHRWARLVEETLGLAVDRGELGLSVPFQVRPGTAVVHPGGTDPRRRWPASRFGEVAARLQAAGCDVVVTGGPHEAGLAATVVRVGRLPPTSNLAGALDVRVLTGLLASATVVVCGDTGVGHLATAVGTPSVLLFGPVSPAQWGPPPDRWRHRVLYRPGVDARDLDVPPGQVAELALRLRVPRTSRRTRLSSAVGGRANGAGGGQPMPRRRERRRPTVDDVDPQALAVDALDDETRLHRGGGETETVVSVGGEVVPVDEEGRPQPPSARATGGKADERGEG